MEDRTLLPGAHKEDQREPGNTFLMTLTRGEEEKATVETPHYHLCSSREQNPQFEKVRTASTVSSEHKWKAIAVGGKKLALREAVYFI